MPSCRAGSTPSTCSTRCASPPWSTASPPSPPGSTRGSEPAGCLRALGDLLQALGLPDLGPAPAGVDDARRAPAAHRPGDRLGGGPGDRGEVRAGERELDEDPTVGAPLTELARQPEQHRGHALRYRGEGMCAERRAGLLQPSGGHLQGTQRHLGVLEEDAAECVGVHPQGAQRRHRPHRLGVLAAAEEGEPAEEVAGGEEVDHVLPAVGGGAQRLGPAAGQDVQVLGALSGGVDLLVLGPRQRGHPGVHLLQLHAVETAEQGYLLEHLAADRLRAAVGRGAHRPQRDVATGSRRQGACVRLGLRDLAAHLAHPPVVRCRQGQGGAARCYSAASRTASSAASTTNHTRPSRSHSRANFSSARVRATRAVTSPTTASRSPWSTTVRTKRPARPVRSSKNGTGNRWTGTATTSASAAHASATTSSASPPVASGGPAAARRRTTVPPTVWTVTAASLRTAAGVGEGNFHRLAPATLNDMHKNLLGPEPTYLPEDHPDMPARAALEAGQDLRDVAAKYPAASHVWALLAREALSEQDPVAAYAYARTGYHRGLDALRRAGWRGAGPIPADHVPNQGFLAALEALADAAAAIGEDDEAERCRTFLADATA